MDLVLSGPLARQVLVMAKKDPKLAVALAEQFLGTIQPNAMADYLLTPEVVAALLAERIKRNPEVTLRELQALPTGKSSRRPTAKGAIVKAKSLAARGRRRRIRLTAAQIDKLKTDVRRFLGQHPWATRKQIGKAVGFPSLATYNRIMSELRSAGDVQSHGEKAKTVYALKSAGKAKALPVKAKPSKPSRPKVKKVKKAKKAKGAPKPAAKAAAKKKAAKKTARRSDGPKTTKPRLCPYPDCKNVAAPVFGMMCREHKDVPKPEREQYFAQRRAQGEATA
jgi:hypothetical protein